jgi:hypothetical protein
LEIKSFGTEVVLVMVKRFGVTLITRGASKKKLAVQPPFKGAAMVVESSALGFQPHLFQIHRILRFHRRLNAHLSRRTQRNRLFRLVRPFLARGGSQRVAGRNSASYNCRYAR